MSILRTAVAAIIYATLMTVWAVYREAPLAGSYVLAFVIYAVIFGILFHLLMNWLARREASKTR